MTTVSRKNDIWWHVPSITLESILPADQGCALGKMIEKNQNLEHIGLLPSTFCKVQERGELGGKVSQSVNREYYCAKEALSAWSLRFHLTDKLIIWGLLPYPKQRQPGKMVLLRFPSFTNGFILQFFCPRVRASPEVNLSVRVFYFPNRAHHFMCPQGIKVKRSIVHSS